MVFVSVSETYDLSTVRNKMTLIGIHTPKKEIIKKTYPGLLMNSRFIRVVSQDVELACASVLPAAVTEVGFSEGEVAPEDLFNPILYKAVSNESMSTLEYRLAGLGHEGVPLQPALEGQQAIVENDNVTSLSDDFGVYYSLLANRDGFRTANPQVGLSMKNLKPLVFEKYFNYGVNHYTDSDQVDDIRAEVVEGSAALKVGGQYAQAMRGAAHPMPRFNTTFITGVGGNTGVANGMKESPADGVPYNYQADMPNVLPVYTAMILMPPSKLHKLYYRLHVRTVLEFTEIRPIQEVTSFTHMNSYYSTVVYHSDYNDQSKILESSEGMVDVGNGQVKKIMEGA